MAVIHVKLLTDEEQLIGLCQQYWQLDESGEFTHLVEALSKAHGLSVTKLRKVVDSACHAFFPDRSCVRCGEPQKLEGRAQFKRALSYRAVQSPRTCDECEKEKRRKALQLISDAIRADLEKKRSLGLLMGRLTCLDTVLLASLLHARSADELAKLKPVGYRLLTPTVEFDEFVLRHLFTRRLICVHPESHPQSVRIEAEAIADIAWHGVHWTLPLPQDGPSPLQFRRMLEDSLFPGASTAEWSRQARQLRSDLVVEKCVQYLGVQLKHCGLRLPSADRVRAVFRSLAKTFSISQIYYFIWHACRSALSFCKERRAHPAHAANTIPKRMENVAQRVCDGTMKVREFDPDRRAQNSDLCTVLLTSTLNLPLAGFREIPACPDD